MNLFIRLMLAFTIIVSSGLLLNNVFAQDETPGAPEVPEYANAPYKTFLPLAFRSSQYTISGRVTDYYGNPMSGVTVEAAAGSSSVTNGSGQYTLSAFEGLNAVAASKTGTLFNQSAVDMKLNSPMSGVDFSACANFIQNGSFENYPANFWWEIRTDSGTGYNLVYPAIPVGAPYPAHTGTRSVFLGNDGSRANVDTFSDIRTPLLHIPANATSATFTVWIAQYTTEPPAKPQPQLGDEPDAPTNSDMQYVKVLNSGNITIDNIKYFARKQTGAWNKITVELAQYAGQSIKVDMGVYNDGIDGVTWMYVDDAQFDICAPVLPPDPPLPPPPTPGCTERFLNSNFEVNGGWHIPATMYSAGYSWDFWFSPFRSMRTGIYWPGHNRYSFSEFRQKVTIPWSATSVNLNFETLRLTGESGGLFEPEQEMPKTVDQLHSSLSPDSTSDMQYLLLLDAWGNILRWIDYGKTYDPTWRYFEYRSDATAPWWLNYRGWTLWVNWGTYNNGWSGVTSMYVDNAHFVTCQP